MKITFEDNSHIEIKKENNKILVIVQARDHINSKRIITNTVELTQEEFNKLISCL